MDLKLPIVYETKEHSENGNPLIRCQDCCVEFHDFLSHPIEHRTKKGCCSKGSLVLVVGPQFVTRIKEGTHRDGDFSDFKHGITLNDLREQIPGAL